MSAHSHQQHTDPLLRAAYGKSVFAAAATHDIPQDSHEYWIRKNLNDAAYNSLSYVPYCGCTPVCDNCQNPKFMWSRKQGR